MLVHLHPPSHELDHVDVDVHELVNAHAHVHVSVDVPGLIYVHVIVHMSTWM